MSKKTVNVTPNKDNWRVKISGNERASTVTSTQKAAIEIGRQKAKDMNTELVLHGKNGKIRDKDSYGNDPCPPKDKKN
jgi:hypothetical protein